MSAANAAGGAAADGRSPRIARAMTPDGNAEGRPTEAGSADGSTLSPFESLAASYDDTFTRTRIGAAMRRAVWRRLDATFAAPARVLELGCGTGEDAIHLAGRGVRVVAADRERAMLDAVETKARGL